MRSSWRLVTILVALAPAGVSAETPKDEEIVQHAKALFEKYTSLGQAFDPKIADLYADTALIQNRRVYSGGKDRVLTVAAAEYKKLIKAALPLGKERGDKNTYSKVQYAVEKDRVRIKATRYSELKKYSSPLSLLVGKDENGDWLIFEELSESRP
jgi:hypothetical protein